VVLLSKVVHTQLTAVKVVLDIMLELTEVPVQVQLAVPEVQTQVAAEAAVLTVVVLAVLVVQEL
jgi:hypothetical protein